MFRPNRRISSGDPSLCPKGFKKMNDKCFKLNTYAENMEKAADNCREQNTKSSLAVIDNDETNRYLACIFFSFT